MKIDGNNLKVGDTVWYKFAYEYKKSTIKDILTNMANTPLIIMENGDGIFINEDCFYSEKDDISTEMIEEILYKANEEIKFLNNDIISLATQIKNIYKMIERMQVLNV